MHTENTHLYTRLYINILKESMFFTWWKKHFIMDEHLMNTENNVLVIARGNF